MHPVSGEYDAGADGDCFPERGGCGLRGSGVRRRYLSSLEKFSEGGMLVFRYQRDRLLSLFHKQVQKHFEGLENILGLQHGMGRPGGVDLSDHVESMGIG